MLVREDCFAVGSIGKAQADQHIGVPYHQSSYTDISVLFEYFSVGPFSLDGFAPTESLESLQLLRWTVDVFDLKGMVQSGGLRLLWTSIVLVILF